MTTITAVTINAILGAGLVGALAHVLGIPFRVGRPTVLAQATYLPDANRDELRRAA
jgi:hypothetical protein